MLTSLFLIAIAIILVSVKLIKNAAEKYKIKNSKTTVANNKENLVCQICGLEFHKDKFLAHVMDSATANELDIKRSPVLNLLTLNKHKLYLSRAITETQIVGGNLEAVNH